MSQSRPVSVKLISSTQYPLETLYLIWMQSRRDQSWPSAERLNKLVSLNTTAEPFDYSDVIEVYKEVTKSNLSARWGYWEIARKKIKEFQEHFSETIEMLLNEAVPVTENISFTFLLENIPITLREQLVRHRIGTHPGPSVSPDILLMPQIPDLAESTFWSQTARVVPWDNFYTNGRYILPESLEGKAEKTQDPYRDISAKEIYLTALNDLESVYNRLLALGVPLEDARNLIPLGATHSMTWTLNLKAMMHIFGKRSSWIAQASIWEEVLAGISKHMTAISPFFQNMFLPQCFKKGKYVGCPVSGTNVERVIGTDGDMPPCPVWVRYETQTAMEASLLTANPAWDPLLQHEPEINFSDLRQWKAKSRRSREMLNDNVKRFENLWQFSIFSGGKVNGQ